MHPTLIDLSLVRQRNEELRREVATVRLARRGRRGKPGGKPEKGDGGRAVPVLAALLSLLAALALQPWAAQPAHAQQTSHTLTVLVAGGKVTGPGVDCGAGFDRVLADRKDSVAKDCEKVFVGRDSGDEFEESIPRSFFRGLPPNPFR